MTIDTSHCVYPSTCDTWQQWMGPYVGWKVARSSAAAGRPQRAGQAGVSNLQRSVLPHFKPSPDAPCPAAPVLCACATAAAARPTSQLPRRPLVAPRRPLALPTAMSKRGSHGPPPTRPDYTAAEPVGPPPPSPLDEAARAATAEPNPIPQPSTSKGALEGSTSWVPAALQPAAMLAVGEQGWSGRQTGGGGAAGSVCCSTGHLPPAGDGTQLVSPAPPLHALACSGNVQPHPPARRGRDALILLTLHSAS